MDKSIDLAAVLKQLDPANKKHWNNDGSPSMEAIEKIAGKKKFITRKELSELYPLFTKDNPVVESKEPEALLGSSVLANSFLTKDGTALVLGDVVHLAFLDSKLTVEEWNALEEDNREKLLADKVAELELVPEDAPPVEGTAAPKPAADSDGPQVEEAPAALEVEELEAKKDAIDKEIASKKAAQNKLQREINELTAESDKINTEIEQRRPHMTNQGAIMDYIASQNRRRAERFAAVPAGGVQSPKAKIDQAMQANRGFGNQRPTIPVPKMES